mmetsp:Transcript_28501/g.50156  ORF Transcript_28501/g.50156 Transcript_28501/m.50156 type:complete len:109 (+) Transcript_28501:520-846(+)
MAVAIAVAAVGEIVGGVGAMIATASEGIGNEGEAFRHPVEKKKMEVSARMGTEAKGKPLMMTRKKKGMRMMFLRSEGSIVTRMMRMMEKQPETKKRKKKQLWLTRRRM